MKCVGKMLFILLTFSGFLINIPLYSQNDFSIENDKGEYKQKFELVNDLVIIPVEVNGRELAFLLDTGVNTTILFSFSSVDTSTVNNPTIIYLKGIGSGKPIRGFISENNTLKIGDIESRNHSLYIIEGGVLSISNRLGIPINGILGYDFFEDFVVEFNYRRQLMRVYEKEKYEYKRCRRCIEVPLIFYKNKPYVRAEVSISGKEKIPVDLLVDSGSGDAVWLFQSAEDNIYVPEESFEDFLGFGIGGSVYGQRSRIDQLSIGKYDLEEVTASFPDTSYLANTNTFEERNGSLGAQVIKRFHSIFDYPDKKLTIKPNAEFKDPFEYNMSGVIVEHNGYNVVKNDAVPDPVFQIKENDNNSTKVYSSTRQVFYTLERSYIIAEIRPGSPAQRAGLKTGDELVELNGRPVYKYNLQKINEIFSSKEGKRIRIEVLRDGKFIEVAFRLERIL